MTRGAEYVPVLAEYTKTLPKEDYPTAKLALMACQRYCFNLIPCAYFSMTFPDRICQISPPTAQMISPILKSIGGPRVCGKKDVQKPLLPDYAIHIESDTGEGQEDSGTAKSEKMDFVRRQFRSDPLPELLHTHFSLSITLSMAFCCMVLVGASLLVRRIMRQSHHRRGRWARNMEVFEHLAGSEDYSPTRWARSLGSLE